MVDDQVSDESGAMDETSTTEQPTQPGQQGPRVTREQATDLGRLRRSVTDRHIAGVAGGLARHLDIDPIIVRVLLVVSLFFGGAGLVAYVGAWILVPEEGTDDQPLGLDERSRTVGLIGVGVLALLSALGTWAGAFSFPWQLAVIGAVVLWFVHRSKRARSLDSGYGATSAPPTYDPTYEPTDEPGSTYAPEQDWSYAAPPESYLRPARGPRNPRRRGPKLFLFTVALIALAEGVLGVVDLAGAPVVDSAYPALALGIVAAMLLVGSFWGRAGGLIALGLVAAIATAATFFPHSVGDSVVRYAPASAAQVQDSYDLEAGDLVLDLTDVSDVEALDGREIAIDAVAGQIEVIVPDDVDVSVSTQVVVGQSRLFSTAEGGFDVNHQASRDGGADAPELSLSIDLVAGEILVRDAA